MATRAKLIEDQRLTRQSLDALFEEYYPKLFNYVYYRTLNRVVADDVTATCMLSIVKNYATFDPARGNLSAWVYRIARNELYTYFRKDRGEADIETVPESLVSYTDDYDDLDDRGALVRKALEELSDEERELVYLKYWEELSNKEIAKRLGINASTVSTKLWRAVNRMRKVMPQTEG